MSSWFKFKPRIANKSIPVIPAFGHMFDSTRSLGPILIQVFAGVVCGVAVVLSCN